MRQIFIEPVDFCLMAVCLGQIVKFIRIGVKLEGRRVPREGYPVVVDGNERTKSSTRYRLQFQTAVEDHEEPIEEGKLEHIVRRLRNTKKRCKLASHIDHPVGVRKNKTQAIDRLYD